MVCHDMEEEHCVKRVEFSGGSQKSFTKQGKGHGPQVRN